MSKKIALENINDFFEAVSKNQELFLPVDTGEGATYKKYQEGMKLSKALNTNRSAKDFFFPQVENLVDFKVKNKGKEIEIIESFEPVGDFTIFGVKACDAASFDILDRVYLQEPFLDEYYKRRRESATVVTLVCQKPQETCFCGVFDIDATAPGGDVEACVAGENLLLEAKTAKGEQLLEACADVLADAAPSDVESATLTKAATKEVLDKLPIRDISLRQITETPMLDNFNSEIWDDMSNTCLGCGTCTFVCPTCQCFDIRDFNTGDGVKRFRCWDSCMYSDFTKMAAANSRPTQLQRFRQRFMHKLMYFPSENEGVYGCVGCGRCLRSCPISTNIVKVAKALGGEKDE